MDFIFLEGIIYNECEISKIKIYLVVEIKYTKLIL